MTEPSPRYDIPDDTRERPVINLRAVEAVGNTATGDVSVDPIDPANTLRSREKLAEGQAVYEVELPAGKIGLFGAKDFDPQVAPGTPTYPRHEYLDWIESYATRTWDLKKDGKKLYAGQRGMLEKSMRGGKELPPDVADATFNFIGNYLANDEDGKRLADELGIERIDALTPGQALWLTGAMASDLIKYDRAFGSGPDNMSALDLLQHGVDGKKAGNIEPLGVCRHYALAVKVMFEALKAKQDPDTSRLNNTYCIDAASMSRDMYDPIIPRKGAKDRHGGHAWNSFVTVTDKGIEAAVIDATWAKRNKKGEFVGMSHTVRRMSWLVRHSEVALRSMPSRERLEGIRQGVDFYEQMIGQLDAHIEKLVALGGTGSAETVDTNRRVQYYHLIYATRLLNELPKDEKIPKRFRQLYVDMVNDDTLELNSSQISDLAKLFVERGKGSGADKAVDVLFERVVQRSSLLDTGLFGGTFIAPGNPFASRAVAYWKANPDKIPAKMPPVSRKWLGI